MAETLKVINRRGGVIGAVVTVEAVENSSAVYGSLFGDRKFYLRQGQRLSIRVDRDGVFEGDIISMERLVNITKDWSRIPWVWA